MGLEICSFFVNLDIFLWKNLFQIVLTLDAASERATVDKTVRKNCYSFNFIVTNIVS